MSVDFSLTGHTTLVTGAGRGLGRAIAHGLRELGATVHGTSRTDEGARAIAEDLSTEPLVLDVTDVAHHGEFAASLPEVDLLVNNAGTIAPAAAVDATVAEFDEVMDTNLRGTFFLSQAFGRQWIARGIAGSIVNVGSQTGTVAIEERAVYGASKAALDNFTKVLALEWAPHRIRVNAIAPTWIRTELAEKTLSRSDWADELLGRIPLGRFGDPEDVVGATAFLLGDRAAMITGHTLLIDGGYTVR